MLSHLESLGDFDPQDFILDVRKSDVLNFGIPQIVKLWPLHFSHPFFLNLIFLPSGNFPPSRPFGISESGTLDRNEMQLNASGQELAGCGKPSLGIVVERVGPEPEGRMVTNEPFFFNCLRFFSIFFAAFWMPHKLNKVWDDVGCVFIIRLNLNVGNGNMGKTWALPTSSPCVPHSCVPL